MPSSRSLQSLLLRVAFGLVAFGGRAVSRDVWEKAGGNIRQISDMLEYTPSLTKPVSLNFSQVFRDKHPKVVKYLEDVASLPGSCWKVSVGVVDGVGAQASSSSASSARSKKLKGAPAEHQVTDMEGAFTCVRKASTLRRVGICHRYFPLPLNR
jgi:hypothetical protein